MLANVSLRARLFGTYLILLLVMLVLLSVMSVLFASAQTVPPALSWSQLEVLLPTLAGDMRQLTLSQITRDGDAANVEQMLDNFAQTNNTRTLLLFQQNGQWEVQHDSAGVYAGGMVVPFELQPFTSSRLQPEADTEVIFGSFANPDDREWLFAGYSRRIPRTLGGRLPEAFAVLVAEPRSTESLQAALSQFGTSTLRPLIPAGLLGGAVAFALAIFMSRYITRPLRQLTLAAGDIAQGKLGGEVAVSGPLEIQAVANAFNRMTAEVHASQRSQREFLASVSHDLKTPLTSIQGYSQAIIDGAAKNPQNAARIIHEEATRLNRMVSELTDLARLQAGRLSMNMTAIDMGELVAAIGQRLSLVAAKKDIELHVDASPMPHIAGDGDRLVQVVTNLVSNAIKYTPKGGEVWVGVQMLNKGVQLTVKDTGIGIPAKDLPHIFEHFYQVDKARGPQRGTGLGLAITREIVLAHGGTIDIHSAGKNQGTTVMVWLPSPQLSTVISRREMP